MKITESSIERKIRESTPPCVYGISENIAKYNCRFFNVQIAFRDCVVYKGMDEKSGELFAHKTCVPDFVLLNEKDMSAVQSLVRAFELGETAEYTLSDYFCSRSGLYFIEAFGDYWHSRAITGVDEREHEEEVRRAYEASGHHVLILWEHDILSAWDEKCLPLIMEFVERFRSDGNIIPGPVLSVVASGERMGDDCVKCMHDVEFRRSLPAEELDRLSREAARFYAGRELSVNSYEMRFDYFRLSRWSGGPMTTNTRFGRNFLWGVVGGLMLDGVRDAGGLALREAMRDEARVAEAIRGMLSQEDDVNFISVAWRMIRDCGMALGAPFNVSDIVFRLRNLVGDDRRMLFDPYCQYGETMVAAKLLGFRRYMGFAEDSAKRKALLELARWIEYDGVEIHVASLRNSFPAVKAFGFNAIVCSCLDDVGKIDMVAGIAADGRRVFVHSRLRDFRGVRDGVSMTRVEHWKPEPVSESEFYRLSPRDEHRHVRCEECGLSFSSLRGHLKMMHGMTTRDYSEAHPLARVTSQCESDRVAEANRKKYEGIENHHYHKRFAYLLPDGTYTGKADKYRREWGRDEIAPEHVANAEEVGYRPAYAVSGEEGEDYVVCAICGEKKGSLTQHLRKAHGLSKKEYEERYHRPVHCAKNREAFSEATKQKWRTQFATGASVPAAPRRKAENPITRKRDDITVEMLDEAFGRGLSQLEVCRELGCTDTTLRKWMGVLGFEMPSMTVVAIRKAVAAGAELNLEKYSYPALRQMLDGKATREEVMARFGVRRTVFDTWLEQSRKSWEQRNGEEVLRIGAEAKKMLAECGRDFENASLVEKWCEYFRRCGFPYPSYPDGQAKVVAEGVRGAGLEISADGHIGPGATVGNDWLLSFFPNFFECWQDGRRSARWQFDNNLEHIVRDMLKYDDKPMTDGLLRKYLLEHGRISGFRPAVAKLIYDRYCPREGGAVMDPCGGWGGRMLGAYCSDRVARYDCYDASRATCAGLKKVSDALDGQCGKKPCSVIHGAFENSRCAEGEYDVVFTSPPYFSKEHYSDDTEQSSVRYPSYEQWRDGFLRGFMEKSFRCLKNGGVLVVNIDDVVIKGEKHPLRDDLMRIANAIEGLVLEDTLYMDYRNRYVGAMHGEPIYVFRKM